MTDLVHLILISIGGAFLALLEYLRLKKLRHRRQENHCIHCNYDLRGTTAECLECGKRRDSPIC